MKLLLLSYYWPPAGGIAVQRWLQTTHYLAELGWEITVCTSANPDYPQIDEKLIQEVHSNIKVIKINAFEPRKELSKLQSLLGKKEKSNLDNSINSPDKEQSFLQKSIVWIRSNFFIPDARIAWSKAIEKELSVKLKNDLPDIIISTGPPHSTHLAGMKLSKKFNLPWVADFRDPWMEIEYFEHLRLSENSRKKHQTLESQVLTNADLVTTVSPSWAKLFESKGAKKTAVIFNGFDERSFDENKEVKKTEKFIIAHLGTMGMDRNVPSFYGALEDLLIENKEIKQHTELHFAGNTDKNIIDTILQKENLKSVFKNSGIISHHKAVEIMKSSELLLLIQNQSENNIKGRIPAKFFEYLASQKNILLIGDEQSDLAKIMQENKIGFVANFDDKEKIKTIIKTCFDKRNNPNQDIEKNIIHQFSRKTMTKKLSAIMLEMIEKAK